MINNYHKLLVFLFAVFCLLACNQERLPCTQPTIMSVQLGCHMVIGKDTLNNPVLADTGLLFPELLAKDSFGVLQLFKYTQVGITTLTVHMSSIADSCKWIVGTDSLAFQQNRADTLTFYYSRELHFLSNSCGYTYFYNLQNVKLTTDTTINKFVSIDSVKIVNASVTTNVNTEHVQIYIHRP